MTNRAVDKLQACLNGLDADFLDLFGIADAFDVLVCAELKVDFVGIVDGFLRLGFADKRRKIAADLVAK